MSDRVELHKPVIVTDGAPWADHDYVCPVCQVKGAVLDLDSGRFQPCWGCQSNRWRVLQVSHLARWWHRFLWQLGLKEGPRW